MPSRRTDWETPPWLFELLHEEFRFDVDAAASPENAKLPRFWTAADDGLAQSWTGLRVWCNPPYGGQVGAWVRAARQKVRAGTCPLAVLLVPVRTETRWWHEEAMNASEIRFVRGRVHFLLGGRRVRDSRPVFASAVLVFWPWGHPRRVRVIDPSMHPRLLSIEAPNPRRLVDGRRDPQLELVGAGAS